MKKLILLFLISALTGCTHYYYAPNAANIPLFKEKNTFKGKAGFGGGNNYNGGDIQLAYSPGKKIAIMVNSFFAGKTEQVEEISSGGGTHEESGKGSYVEAGAGYYKAFGEKKVWIFETYAGAGVGGQNHVYNFQETSRLNISKYFIQPSFGYSSHRGTLEIAVGSRFSRLNLKITQNNISDANNQSSKPDLDYISIHPSSFLWEPSIMLAAGWPNIKFYLQLTESQNLTTSYLAQDSENFNLGIKVSFKNNPNNKQNVKSK
jgi:hypothetical protein